ncbi:MAG: hypothetical protein KDD94_02470 [Calditrichaeota bacterium]|nr:hypothetical protein [Calditrichota bacterium]
MMKLHQYIIALLFTFLYACGGSSDNETNSSPEQQSKMAWEEFSSGNYDDALAGFNQALEKDSTLIEAISGKGWVLILLDDLQSAEQVLSIDPAKMTDDMTAGLAFIYNAIGDYQNSIDYSLTLLLNPNWVFTYDPNIDHTDIRLVLAQDYISIGDFENAKITFLVIEPTFEADITTAEGQLLLLQAIEAKNPGLNSN